MQKRVSMVAKPKHAMSRADQRRREELEDKRRVAANARIAAQWTDEQVRQVLARCAKLREKSTPEELNDE